MTSDDVRLVQLPPNARRAVPMLRVAWHDVLLLKESQSVWRQLRGPLAGFGNAGLLVHDWYSDHVLAGCRRLLDDKQGSSSVVRALRLVQKDAPTLTVDLLCHVAGRRDDRSRAEITEAMTTLAGGSTELTRAAVHHSIDQLRKTHEQVTDLASSVVAHRATNKNPTTVADEHVDTLLQDVFDVVQQWTALLDGVHLADQRLGTTGVRPLRTALELFDWQRFVEASSEAQAQVGPAAPPHVYETIERSASAEFVFEVPERWRRTPSHAVPHRRWRTTACRGKRQSFVPLSRCWAGIVLSSGPSACGRPGVA